MNEEKKKLTRTKWLEFRKIKWSDVHFGQNKIGFILDESMSVRQWFFHVAIIFFHCFCGLCVIFIWMADILALFPIDNNEMDK